MTSLAIHGIAGSLGLIVGFLALFAAKGGRLHRQSGMTFVYAMMTVGLMGAVMAAVETVAETAAEGGRPRIRVENLGINYTLVIRYRRRIDSLRPCGQCPRWTAR